jgi:hypothetical protein
MPAHQPLQAGAQLQTLLSLAKSTFHCSSKWPISLPIHLQQLLGKSGGKKKMWSTVEEIQHEYYDAIRINIFLM